MTKYQYIGPSALLKWVSSERKGFAVHTIADLPTLLTSKEQTFTFIVSKLEILHLADRHSEHIVCAGGEMVLAAGEITFAAVPRLEVIGLSNQSTGYAPDLASWSALAEALDRIGIVRPSQWTQVFVFRCCPNCGQLNIVKEANFYCAACDFPLPKHWNITYE